jgi:glycosyltransferase involved in cell wall biosynthesis
MADGETGVLVGDEWEFFQAVRALVLDPQQRTEMGTAAAAYSRRFTWSTTGAAFARVVADQLPAARPRADQRVP